MLSWFNYHVSGIYLKYLKIYLIIWLKLSQVKNNAVV